jgi:hypothetical protein
MIRARLAVDGLKEATQRLDEVGDRARHPQPALRHPNTQQDLQESQRRKFARGGWRKATPRWIEQKRRAGLDTRTLRATGRLESALVNATHGVKATVVGPDLRWGLHPGRSDIYYAQALATGSAHMPPRRAVVIDPTARERISQRVQNWIADGAYGRA